MRRAIKVFLGARPQPLGTLYFDAQGARQSSAFEYEASWLRTDDHFALDPALPLIAGPQFARGGRDRSVFHAAIVDTEPDGWAKRVILRDHAHRRRAALSAKAAAKSSFLNQLDFLLAVDDISRVGALRLCNEDGVFQREVGASNKAPLLVDLNTMLSASRAVETQRETSHDLAYLRGRATSLGGMRPKCALVGPGGRLSIAKFPSVHDERSVPHGEVLALHLAAMAGIDAAESRLLDCGGTAVAVIARFDRTTDQQRRMYVSAATMLQDDSAGEQEHTYTEIADVLRTCSAFVRQDLEELWRRMAFSILITNVDDHLRNHGFLHVEGSKWRLAPAFDVNPFPERARELKTWVSEEAGPEATVSALMAAAPYFGLSTVRAREVLQEVEQAVRQWRSVGRGLGMTEMELQSFAEAFEHDERAAAQRLCGRS